MNPPPPTLEPTLNRWTAAAWAGWCVVLGGLAVNWHRLALLPPTMNPVQHERLVAAWLVALALTTFLATRRRPALAPASAAALAGTSSLPPDLWPLGAAIGLCLAGWAHRPWLLASGFAAQAGIAFAGAYERIYGVVSAESSSTLFQTAPAEAGHYLLHLLTPGWIVNQAAYAATLLAAARFQHRPLTAGTGGAAILTLALLAASPGLLERGLALRQGAQRHAEHLRTVVEATPPAARRAQHAELDVVWVIGESQSRWLWQLYGYPRPTTPGLQARRLELVLLGDAVSPHSYTVQSMLQTGYRARVGADGSQVSLLHLLRSAGIRVEWHSAQETFGPWASPIAEFAAGADTTSFYGSHLRWQPRGSPSPERHPDRLAQQALLRSLNAPAAGPRVLVHHMFAAHDPYCAHRPAQPMPDPAATPAAWFGAAANRWPALACYEGAVRFSDEVLSRYLESLAGRQRPAILVFVPDHGEAPEDGSGHNADRPSPRHLEIPAVVYFNEAARTVRAPSWQWLRQHADLPFLGSWTYELLLELTGVEAPELRLLSPPRLAPTFRAPPRVIYPHGRRWTYDGDGPALDLLTGTRQALARLPGAGRTRPPIYAHRVNTVLKGMEAARYFDGVEIDIVAGAGQILVNHPPMPASGLTLDELLQALAIRPGLKLWLDFKNPGISTAETLEALAQLDGRWNLRGRTVLELPADTPEAVFAAYAAAGWSTSLYLPDDFASCGAASASGDACDGRAQAWLAMARRTGIGAFSFDDALRAAVDRHLRPGAGSLRLLSWKLSLRSDDPALADAAADLAPLDALIVSFHSTFSP